MPEDKKTPGQALLEIEDTDGFKVLRAMSDGLKEDALKELDDSEEGGERNRGIRAGLTRLFDDVDSEMAKAKKMEAEEETRKE